MLNEKYGMRGDVIHDSKKLPGMDDGNIRPISEVAGDKRPRAIEDLNQLSSSELDSIPNPDSIR